ncbi:MAG TPA: transposase domain-containing protein [Kaistia sp.]|nr:transposase domain-containing protein [Kaistia sp.]
MMVDPIREWWTAAEFAAMGLPGVPVDKGNLIAMIERNGHHAQNLAWPTNPNGVWRKRRGKGGGREYRADVLPTAAQTRLAMRQRRAQPVAAPTPDAAKAERDIAGRHAWFETLPERRKAQARDRLALLLAVRDLEVSGMARDLAMMDVAAEGGVSLRTLYNWAGLVAGLERQDWLPALAPRFTGRVAEVDCDEAAWEALRSLYLRPEQPNFSDCYRDLEKLAAAHGWTIPSARTLERRLAEIPTVIRVLKREGINALKELYPAQRRVRTDLNALEAVNADGHKWDVFCKWPDGFIGRPVSVFFQDLYSNMALAWRTARSENTATVLLAFGDMVQTFGIPDIITLDNGRNFASKWFSGGTPNRYRFKVKDSDPVGVLTQLGTEIHWTTPYSGQSKPIERMFRDFAQGIAKDIRFAGAWTGNTIDAKPENYASTAVPIDLFEAVIAERVAEHNARAGRRTPVCAGKLSFEAAFRLSYQDAVIRRARPEHSRLWLLAAEGITVRQQDGSLNFEGNRYWHEALLEHLGKKVVIRFDADDLHAGLHVYRLDGAYVAHAPCIQDIGFYSKAEGQAANRARRAWMRAQKDASETRFSLDDLVALMPTPAVPEPVAAPRLIRPVFGNLAANSRPANDYEQDEVMTDFGKAVQRLRIVSNENGADE